jgi:hypothetical protein
MEEVDPNGRCGGALREEGPEEAAAAARCWSWRAYRHSSSEANAAPDVPFSSSNSASVLFTPDPNTEREGWSKVPLKEGEGVTHH